jgi:threonyl-tRNA synthetase
MAGFSFSKRDIMKHSYLEAAQKLDLFHNEEHSPGFAWWHPNGLRLIDALKGVIRDVHNRFDYEEVKTPNVTGVELFEQSGHLAKFRHNMFIMDGGEGERAYAVRPMSCPNHIELYDQRRRSYAELPMKVFEFGEVVRNEPSGSLQALFRMRGFTQDDAHVFAMEEQVVDVVADYVAMSRELYRALGFEEVRYQISLRPEQRFGDDALWDKAEHMLRAACERNGLAWNEEEGGGAFYGPKLEMHLTDKLGRSWQMGTIQLDYVLPRRFGLEYLSRENKAEVPVILHHAVLGSIERFIGVLLEQYGVDLPAPLRPVQVALVAVRQSEDGYVRDLAAQLRRQGLRVKTYLGDARLGDKVKAAELEHPEFIAVAGGREAAAGQVAVRGAAGQRVVDWAAFVDELLVLCRFV